MKKLLAIALVAMFLMPFVASQVFAADERAQSGTVNVGNKMCPVSGDPVSGKDFVEYQGKRYGLCCPMCEKPFLANPEKYLAALAEKEKTASEKKTSAHQGMHNM